MFFSGLSRIGECALRIGECSRGIEGIKEALGWSSFLHHLEDSFYSELESLCLFLSFYSSFFSFSFFFAVVINAASDRLRGCLGGSIPASMALNGMVTAVSTDDVGSIDDGQR